MSVGEMTSFLSLDVSEFVRPISEAIDNLKELEGSAKEAFGIVDESAKKSATSVRDVQASSRESVSSVSTLGKSMSALTSALLIGVRVASVFVPQIRVLGVSMRALGWGAYATQTTMAIFSSETKKAGDAAEQNSQSVQKAAQSNRALSSAAELAGIASTYALGATIAWKSGISEIIDASGKYLNVNSSLMKSIGSITTSFRDLVMTGIDMFSEGIKGSLVAVLQATTGFNDLTEAVDFIGKGATSAAGVVSDAMKTISGSAREAGLVFGTALAIFQSGGTLNAAAFYEEGQALNEMAEATQRVIDKQMALKGAFDVINGAQKAAETGRQLAIDQARISGIATVEAIDKEIDALRRRTAEAGLKDPALVKTKEFLKYTEEVTKALEKQRTQILGAEAKGPGDAKATAPTEAAKAYDAAVAGLNKLKFGQEEAARLAIMASDATDDEVVALLALHDETVALAAAQAQQKKQDQAFEQGAERISSLRDEIDKLTGALTAGEVEMNKLMRAGVSEEMAAEIASLIDQAEELRQKDTKKAGAKQDTGNSKASLIGSSETASIFLRGMNGVAPNDIQKKSLNVQEKILEANEMMAAGFKQWPQFVVADF